MKILKPLNLLYVFLFITVMNCSKSSSNISIAGNWIVVSETLSGCTTTTNNGTYAYQCPATSNNSCQKITFTSNTFSSTYSYVDSNNATQTSTGTGTYSINGGSITITGSGSASETYTFTLSGNTLTLKTPKDASTGCVDTIVLNKQ